MKKVSCDHGWRDLDYGNGNEFLDDYGEIIRFYKSDLPLLFIGETGVGKSFEAKKAFEFYKQENHAEGNFVPVDCGCFNASLIEGELYGSKKGSFTGSVRTIEGILKKGNGGAIFFDEIANLPLELQPKILRFVDTKTFSPIGSGGTAEIINTKLIFATNKNLKEMVNCGQFMSDLFHRICAVPIYIKPLDSRRQEIPFLILSLMEKFSIEKKISVQAVEFLVKQQWHGNIRTLENCIKAANALAYGRNIELDDVQFIFERTIASIF
ncbi:MAG: sigma-54-dependent transcriptional regulator [Treponemataceae bacterium]